MRQKSQILLIPGYLVYPSHSGGAVAQTCFLKQYCEHFETHIFLTPLNVNFNQLEEFKKLYPDLIVHYCFTSTSNSFKNRLKRKIVSLIIKFYQFYSPFKITSKLTNPLLTELPPETENTVNKLSAILDQFNFDIIQVEVFRNLAITPLLPDDCVKIFVSQEAQFLRIQSQIAALGREGSIYEKYLEKFQSAMEIALIEKYDGVIVFSEKEAERHKKYLGQTIRISPFTPPERLIPKRSDRPQKLVLLGSEYHVPNREGIEWLLEHEAKALNKMELSIYIIGGWTSGTIKKWKKKYSVHFTGIIDDLDEFMSDAIHLAPIRFGGGLKTKVMDTLKLGVPTIATTHAAEGLPVENNEHLIITDSSKGFTDAVIQLIENDDLRSHLSNNSIKLMKQEFSVEKLGKQRIQTIMDIYEETKMRRTKVF
ncbi:glycosyltransferase family 4 protein [Reichenbachiella sp. MALMAid0571]|uniref:glycosyltransferase family 4 protein n=1 Tax=Reichenbachiella sp. MALMAid0571 TaxID=3143939 RepID=UPI0032DFA237